MVRSTVWGGQDQGPPKVVEPMMMMMVVVMMMMIFLLYHKCGCREIYKYLPIFYFIRKSKPGFF